MLAALGHFLFPANGIRKQRIAAIDDDVAVIHGIGKLINDRIGGLACLHHDDGLAGALQGSDEIRDGLGRNKVSFVTVGLNEGAGLFRAAIIDGDGIAIAGKVAGEVGAHYRQADNTNVREFVLFSHGAYPTSPPRFRRAGG